MYVEVTFEFEFLSFMFHQSWMAFCKTEKKERTEHSWFMVVPKNIVPSGAAAQKGDNKTDKEVTEIEKETKKIDKARGRLLLLGDGAAHQ